ncbi:MAG TPA: winged helix-turn-helix domain-containing protein [Vicinamibacteria bacterium]|nr:winged helix-turn-helix domain-containing protein [Vicinamibacteria bacterium]
MSPEPFVLGEWRVEPSLNQLTRLARGSIPQRITPKAMEVLLVLGARAGEVVTREDLLTSVWPNVHVQEEILTRAVADLRKAFDDDRKEPRYIETIPKRGYRLIAAIAPVERKAARNRLPFWGAAAAAAAVATVVAWGSRDANVGKVVALEGHPLTALPGREIQPALSPDGTRVAFAWQGAKGDNWDIYVKPVSGETLTRLTEDPAFDLSPTWSPDGKRIAFARYREERECGILEVDAPGGTERQVGSCGKSQNPDLAWSPDGRLLAFSDRESDSESFGIYLLAAENGEKRKLIAPEGQHWGDKDPAFSPDGRWVLFTRSVSMNTQDVYRVRVEGGEPERLTSDGREVRGAAFTRDGAGIVVSSARSGSLGLWRIPFEGPSVRLVFEGKTPRAPELGARGEILFEERWRDTDVDAFALGAPEATTEPLVSSTYEDREPALSPDASRVAFVSTRSGSPELWVSDAAGGEAKRLTSFGGPDVGAPSWSPDGRSIVFDARPEGHADVYSISIEGGAATPIAPSPANEVAPVFSPDGRSVLFGSDRSETWQLWRSDAKEPGTSNGGYVCRFRDDTSLYFTKFDSPGLYRLDLKSGAEKSLEGTDVLADGRAWTFDESGILFLGFEAGKIVLYRWDFPSSALSSVGAVDADPAGGLAHDPARKRVLFTRVVRSESDLVIARLP